MHSDGEVLRALQWINTSNSVALLVLLGVGNLAALVYKDVQLNLQSVPSRHSARPIMPKVNIPITELASSDLFGQIATEIPLNRESKTTQTDTRLQLELRGTFASSSTAEGRALIAEKGKSARYYKVSDTLPSGAKLKKVDPEKVTFEFNGRLENLRFNLIKQHAQNQQEQITPTNRNPASSPANNQHGSRKAREDSKIH
ncbi:hypothetical protein G8770_00035 [Aestuariicella hydrocarbonica]|uniref:Type II secretion system protein GspC N-terminal domain-containing protein n=1 Tax=Pseudomaricurvus hydrocarbonicus TaxID=1470433 RepID=A0A9E5MFW7_9GAMM|nr:type II secretion system protein N [Aestuariicella hydrocarbonica]NHO63936.1 hypothetical protein [Aestuariicella hydrocarbonica]